MDANFPFKPVEKKLLYEHVVDQIKRFIIEGQLKPGDPLPSERKLTNMFNVGRPVIREALRTLGLMGLIEANPGVKGSRIRSCSIDVYMEAMREQMSWMVEVDKETIQDLWEVRYFVELGIAHSAAQNATQEDFNRLDKLIKKMEGSLNNKEDYLKYAIEFHETLALSTNNKIFYLVWNGFINLVYRGYSSILEAGALTKLFEVNKVLLRAIKARDHDGINRAAKNHANAEKEFIFQKNRVKRKMAKSFITNLKLSSLP